jgi:hypothetical protein
MLLALDDREAIRRFHSRLLDDDQAFSVVHADMFLQEGLVDEALALSDRQCRRDALRPPPDREFEFQRRQDCLKQWASLLMRAGKRSEAEAVLRRVFHRGPGDIDLLVQLYDEWPEAGSPTSRLAPYHLPPVLEQAALEKITAAKGDPNP